MCAALFVSFSALPAAQELFFESALPIEDRALGFPRFIAVEEGLAVIVQEFEPLKDSAVEGGEIYLSWYRSRDGSRWDAGERLLGPFPYFGTAVPPIYSALATSDGAVYVAVTVGVQETRIYRSPDAIRPRFEPVHVFASDNANVAPLLSEAADGSLLIFFNRNVDGLQTIVAGRSRNGSDWSEPLPIETDPDVGQTFLPDHVSWNGRDYLVYQGIDILTRRTNQLYAKVSTNGGADWGASTRLTDFVTPGEQTESDGYDNQRPSIAVDAAADRLLVAWQRRVGAGTPQVYLLRFDGDLDRAGALEEVTSQFDQAQAPHVVVARGVPVVAWFNTRRGRGGVYVSTPSESGFRRRELASVAGGVSFPSLPVRGRFVHAIWQRGEAARDLRVVHAEPDQRALPPALLAANFEAGVPNANRRVEVVIDPPPDASGIVGYGYTWSQDADAAVPKRVVQPFENDRVVVRAERDGVWYLAVRSQDRGGNWSDAATVRYELDATPPGPVRFPPPRLDENGFSASNTIRIGWEAPPDDDVAAYRVALARISADPSAEPVGSRVPAPNTRITATVIERDNLPNGLWRLVVAPVDRVGNVGPARELALRLNKFRPTTRVLGTTVERDAEGVPRLRILGAGFDSEGSVASVRLDRDGQEPWDHEFRSWQAAFTVVDDGTIEGVSLSDVAPGSYRLEIVHSERGAHRAAGRLQVQPFGVVTYGDFTARFASSLRAVGRSSAPIGGQDALVWMIMAPALLLGLVSSWRLVAIGHDIRRLNTETRLLLRTPVRVDEARRQMLRVKGIGLRVKFTFFIVLLVVSVVVLVAIPLGRNVLRRQEGILVNGLEERVALLVEGLVTGARPALRNPLLTLDQLQNLADQSEAMTAARYATITGLNDAGELHAVYGTTDSAVLETNAASGRTTTTDVYTVGVSRLRDGITEEVEALAAELNRSAGQAVGFVITELDLLNDEAATVFRTIANADQQDAELRRIDEERRELLTVAQQRLDDLAGGIRSEPFFDTGQLRRDETEFLFYKPVLEIDPGAGTDFADYYRGTVRVAISTQLILDVIEATRRNIVIVTVIVAAIALVFGVVGAYVLATIVVIPIDKLVRMVEEISATEDKSELKGRELVLRSRDELNLLATSINQMTAGLVKAAEADKDLLFGKETQKAFIPLQPISEDTKRTFGELDEDQVHFFGYYEGAKGVSGDYFTYQKLSDRFYAVIKCDVAGKGIPAALIMVQVATVFQDYFREWSLESPGLNLSSFVLRVNDIVAERQFKGRFAALTVGILDAQTGGFYSANAGDNQLHVYRHGKGSVEQLTIPGGPAAGTFSSSIMPITFPQEKREIARGDVLLLFTDGLEEAKRLLRDDAWHTTVVSEDHKTRGLVPDDFQVGQDGEEFTNQRIHDIIAAVQSRGSYRLQKTLDPDPSTALEFDYRGCSDQGRDAVLAIVAAERVFRLVPDPTAGIEARIAVDRIVVQFLREHFRQFDTFFGHPIGDDDAEYLQFSHLREDEQFDDITMLAVYRK